MIRRFGVPVAVYTVIFALAALCIPYPFWGDQALFTIGAEMMHNGAVLYVDVWDLVQPGIFVFYLVAGSLFGFTEIGIHLFEFLYVLLMSVVTYYTQRSRFTNAWAAAVVPLSTAGLYYAVAGWWELTQREGLALFPVYLSYWWASRAVDGEPRAGMRRFFLAGFAGAVAASLKHMLVVIPGAFVAVALAFFVVQRKEGWDRRCLVGAVAAGAGLCVGLLLCFGYFFWTAGVDHLLWTFFELPSRISRELNAREPYIFKQTVMWFGKRFAGLLILAGIGWSQQWRQRADALTMNLLVWLLGATAVWAVQLWWQYHLMLLVVPIGLLAAFAVDGMWSWLNQRAEVASPRWAVIGIGALVVCATVPLLIANARRARSFGLAMMGAESFSAGIATYQDKSLYTYAPTRLEVQRLADEDAIPGPIYVFGDPLYIYMSGRRQAIAQNGWSPEMWVPEMWERATSELRLVLPAYIVFTAGYEEWCEKQAAVALLLEDHYVLDERMQNSTWYVLEGALPAAIR